MVWLATVFGWVCRIPSVVMGLTLLAAGTSVPDLLSSIIVAMQGKGRHDPCVVPRAVPIVEAMAALVLADFKLLKRTNKI